MRQPLCQCPCSVRAWTGSICLMVSKTSTSRTRCGDTRSNLLGCTEMMMVMTHRLLLRMLSQHLQGCVL
jgi:hypothetical protein